MAQATEEYPALESVPEPPDPEDEVEAAAEIPPMQVALPGDWNTISTEFGGRAPEASEIRLLGGKMPIEGSFSKGAEFDVVCRVKVTGVLGQDVVDEWGTVDRTVRRHFAKLVSVKRFG